MAIHSRWRERHCASRSHLGQNGAVTGVVLVRHAVVEIERQDPARTRGWMPLWPRIAGGAPDAPTWTSGSSGVLDEV
jgi:hypothetical protein